jgi:FkbM family methyltransferase
MYKLRLIKKVSLNLGLYGPARYLYRHLIDREQRVRLAADAALFRSLVRPHGCLCFDVGANIGEKAETLLEAGYRVVAFEPQADCMAELKARCRRFGGAFLAKQIAVGAACGEATLHVHAVRDLSSLVSGWLEKDVEGQVIVPVTTLDDAIAEFGAPAYVKIDVEGWELEVLKGLSQPVPLISFEYHLIEGGAEAALACLDRVSRYGPVAVNFTPNEELRLSFPEWVTPDEFKRRFPAEFTGRPEWFYGNIFVKAETDTLAGFDCPTVQ